MMTGLNKTKTELSSLQDALTKTQLELEKTNFELHAKKSELVPLVHYFFEKPVKCAAPGASCVRAAFDW